MANSIQEALASSLNVRIGRQLYMPFSKRRSFSLKDNEIRPHAKLNAHCYVLDIMRGLAPNISISQLQRWKLYAADSAAFIVSDYLM